MAAPPIGPIAAPVGAEPCSAPAAAGRGQWRPAPPSDAPIVARVDSSGALRIGAARPPPGDVDLDAFYDGLALVAERAPGDAELFARYHYDAGGLHAVTAEFAPDVVSTHTVHRGALGSTLLLTDGFGAAASSYRTDPWGRLVPAPSLDDPNALVFTGHQHDAATGLIYMKSRMYDPALGAFLSQDSYLGRIDLPASLHRYLYAYGNPGAWVDPDGYKPCSVNGSQFTTSFLNNCENAEWRRARRIGSRRGADHAGPIGAEIAEDCGGDAFCFRALQYGLTDTVTFGAVRHLDRVTAEYTAGERTLGELHDGISDASTHAVAGGAASGVMLLTGGALGGAVGRVSTTFGRFGLFESAPMAQQLVSRALTGATLGLVSAPAGMGIQDVADSAVDYTAGDYARGAAIGFAVGVIAEPILGAAGAGAGRIASRSGASRPSRLFGLLDDVDVRLEADDMPGIGSFGDEVGGVAAGGAGEASTVLLRTTRQLQAKFKHAGDFGVTGNYSRANAAEFSRAIHQHINSPSVRTIQGTYHTQTVTHYLDPSTGLNVIADPAGNFISGWRLSPGQLRNVLTHGGL